MLAPSREMRQMVSHDGEEAFHETASPICVEKEGEEQHVWNKYETKETDKHVRCMIEETLRSWTGYEQNCVPVDRRSVGSKEYFSVKRKVLLFAVSDTLA